MFATQELSGLFELDLAGTVLYHRTDEGAESSGTSTEMVGHNFYDEVVAFENVEEFRLCVTEFLRAAMAAESFDFDCRYGGSAHRVKVLLARIPDMNRNFTKSILVHIRRDESSRRSGRGR